LPKFCPSMMCVDFSRLPQEIEALEKAGADMLHIDVMDGHFVPNFALGIEDIKAIGKLATIPYDVHLMLTTPDPYIQQFADLGCAIIYVHAEAPLHLHRTLGNIRQAGAQAGVAINPGTSLSVLEEVLDITDVVMVMSVNPGFAGQPFVTGSVDKIKRLAQMIADRGLNTKIAIDGAISPQVVADLSDYVEYFVLGTAGLFRKECSYQNALDELRRRAEGESIVAEQL